VDEVVLMMTFFVAPDAGVARRRKTRTAKR
jgi:hypothetical protein